MEAEGVPLSFPLTKLSHSRNHCMLMHRMTGGASSAWNSLFSCKKLYKNMKSFFFIQLCPWPRYLSSGKTWKMSTGPNTAAQGTTWARCCQPSHPYPLTYLNEGVNLHLPALGQSFDFHLANGAHVQVVDSRPSSKADTDSTDTAVSMADLGQQSQDFQVTQITKL